MCWSRITSTQDYQAHFSQDIRNHSRISVAHGGRPAGQPHLPGPQGRHLLAGGGVRLVGQGRHDVAAQGGVIIIHMCGLWTVDNDHIY